ncbi:MAG: hypothetical protein H0X27_07245 [Caulobacteraceae bacterium]|nr:hypothetical protein [Caulobacteraceae bacterium]
MAKLRRLSIIAAVIFVAAPASHAHSRPRLGKLLAARHGAPVRPTRSWSLDLSGARGSIDRPYADIAAARDEGRLRTAVDYRFAPNGMVGSVGYRHIADSRLIDVHEVNRAASTQFGLPDSTLGATLSYTFDR